jgi:catechol 2,3-dioxygenase-like lactoylglutathione lyase family enzyme
MATTKGAPAIFRILVPARDLRESQRFYETLLGLPGRSVGGGRIYFDCGTVILGVLDYSGHEARDFPRPTEAIYFATDHLAEIHKRASALGCTSTDLLHGDRASPMGAIVTRPWGERSFYAQDPSGNALCFVDSGTLYTGTPKQLEAFRRATTGQVPPSR